MSSTSSLFITVDGIDGVGKSTQIRRLVDHLQVNGFDVVTVQDPGSSDVGSRLRALLLDSSLSMHRRTEAMLFMASRSEMIESTIRPALSAGRCVVSDRFLLANVVYQSIGSEIVTAEALWQMGRLAAGDVRPDLTVLLDMPAEIALRRVGSQRDRMEARGVDYMESVRQAFLKELPESSDATLLVDANQTVERVSEELLRGVDDFLSSRMPG